MKLKVAIGALLLAVTNVSLAEITAETYMMSKGTPNEKLYKKYIEGVGKGFEWANVQLKSSGQKPLYCQPNLAMYAENYLSIIDAEIAKDSAAAKNPIELYLLNGLIAIFPCKK